jgi:putative hydrolase of the HAD superfamily
MEPNPKPARGRDLTQITTWIFDLDNTLYPASSGVFREMGERMRTYIRRLLQVDEPQAYEIQKRFFFSHGTTMNGLMDTYGIDPHEYLDFVHDLDLSRIAPDARLAPALSRTTGKRIVFTNGSVGHAERVLAHLGVRALFDDIVDIAASGFSPKPSAAAYAVLAARIADPADRCAMFDDLARNLKPAHALGMATVLVEPDDLDAHHGLATETGDFIDHATADLPSFLNALPDRIAHHDQL